MRSRFLASCLRRMLIPKGSANEGPSSVPTAVYVNLVQFTLKLSRTKLSVSTLICALLAALPFTATAATRSHRAQAKAVGTLIAVNQADRDISLVDPTRGIEIARVPEGANTGHEVAVSPDGRFAFVPIYGDSTPGKPGTNGDEVTVIDIALRRVVHRIRFSHGVRPHCIVLNPHDGLLYVTTELDRSVSIIDPRTLRIIGSIPTGQAESHMLAISPDGRFGYTANIDSGTVSMLDLQTRKLIAVIPVSKTIQRISVSTDGSEIFTADQDEPRLAVIDVAARTVKAWVQLPAVGYGSASTLTGRRLMVTVPTRSLLAVVDTRLLRVAQTIPVPKGPHEVLMKPDGQSAYVACTAAGVVARVDLKRWRVTESISVGKLSDGIGWARDE